MNQQSDWELVDDQPQPQARARQAFTQKDFLYTLLGKYPRLKLAGLATVGMLMVALLALFSLIALAGATFASGLVLFAAWCKARFGKHRKAYQVHIYGK